MRYVLSARPTNVCGHPRKPWYAQPLVAGVLFLLTVWWVWLFLLTGSCSGYSLTFVLRALALTAAMCVAGWALWKGIAWGYLLGLALAGPALVATARYFLVWSDRWPGRSIGWSNVVPDCVILAGLLMPRSVRWFREAWRADHPGSARRTEVSPQVEGARSPGSFSASSRSP